MINKTRFNFAFIFAVLLAVFVNIAAAQTGKTAAQPANPLVQSLPASDAVISFNTQKFLNTALPQLLGADSSKLTQINAHIDQIKDKTGIDLRQFEQAAAGIKYKQISATEIDFEPVILANGKFNAGAVMALVRIAASGKFREEKVGDKTVYVLQVQEIMSEVAQGKTGSSSIEKMMEKVLRTFSGELAVGALDNKTLVIGSAARVKETFAATTAPLNAELKTSANAKPGTILSFAGNVPAGLSKMFGFDNDEFAKITDSIKVLSGYLDMNGTNASLMLAGKTNSVQEAMDLEDTANGLRSMGKALIGMLKASPMDREMYGRLIESAAISRTGNQVKLNLLITQGDLSILAKKL
jgi:hypothetical protein